MCVVEVEEAQRRSGLTAGKRKFRGMTQARIADIIQICTAELCVWLWFQVCRCKCEQLSVWKILYQANVSGQVYMESYRTNMLCQ